jgi:hypothetical protein
MSGHMMVLLACVGMAEAGDAVRWEMQELDTHAGEVVYAVTVADVDGNGKPDVVALTEKQVLVYENHGDGWRKVVILDGQTERDNVCIQAEDIDRDGRVDFALGAGWRPTDTQSGGTLQWIGRDAAGAWKVHAITEEPTLHRIRWGDVLGTGRSQLVATPLHGRGTRGPNWHEGAGARVLVLSVPGDPAGRAWPVEVAAEHLHVIHNHTIIDIDDDGRNEILVAAGEGIHVLKRGGDGKWASRRIGAGDQAAKPGQGTSEIKVGRMRGGRRLLGTIEPWHGHQAVIYLEPRGAERGDGLWERRVVDDQVPWGHAVVWGDFDGDGSDELVIGQRDPRRGGEGPFGPGLWYYDLDEWLSDEGGSRPAGLKQVIDDGGMATEDAVGADLDGDGRLDVVAGGRATHNVRIYWNRGLSER